MDEEKQQPLKEENATETATATGGGGWGWGFSPFSLLSDLQKAAAAAADEISRNVSFKSHSVSFKFQWIVYIRSCFVFS